MADLLRTIPDLKVIATSRTPLHVSGEQEFPVPGLPVPPDPGQLGGYEQAVQGGPRAIDRRPPLDVRGGPPLHRPGGRRPARLRGHERERAGGRGDLRPPPRHAPRHRARRGPGEAAQPGRDPRPPRAPAQRPGGRGPRPAGPPADAPRRDRLELRHPRRAPATPPRPAGGLRRRLRARGRRGDRRPVRRDRHRRPRRAPGPRRPEPDPVDRGRTAALRDARHDPRVRGRDAGGPRRRRGHPRPPRSLVPGARRGVGAAPRRRRPAVAPRAARARARQPPGRPRPGRGRRRRLDRDPAGLRDVALLAEARPPQRGAAAAGGVRRGRPGPATTRSSGPA